MIFFFIDVANKDLIRGVPGVLKELSWFDVPKECCNLSYKGMKSEKDTWKKDQFAEQKRFTQDPIYLIWKSCPWAQLL